MTNPMQNYLIVLLPASNQRFSFVCLAPNNHGNEKPAIRVVDKYIFDVDNVPDVINSTIQKMLLACLKEAAKTTIPLWSEEIQKCWSDQGKLISKELVEECAIETVTQGLSQELKAVFERLISEKSDCAWKCDREKFQNVFKDFLMETVEILADQWLIEKVTVELEADFFRKNPNLNELWKPNDHSIPRD